MMLLLF